MREYGLLLQTKHEYSTPYVQARVYAREPEKDYPLGCRCDGESAFDKDVPKHMHGLMLDGLGMYGFVTESDAAFIGDEAVYRDVYSINLQKLAAMAKTLKRVQTRMDKDKAIEPGDRFIAFAESLKLTFAVEQFTSPRSNEAKWRWMPIIEGRNRYRALIEQARAAAMERKGIKAAS